MHTLSAQEGSGLGAISHNMQMSTRAGISQSFLQ
jgi:hypothetical protein